MVQAGVASPVPLPSSGWVAVPCVPPLARGWEHGSRQHEGGSVCQKNSVLQKQGVIRGSRGKLKRRRVLSVNRRGLCCK